WLKLNIGHQHKMSGYSWDENSSSIQEKLNDLPGPGMADKLNQFHLTRNYPLLHIVGNFRGGYSPWGGVTWADIRESVSGAIDHYHQIVGHSKVKEPIRHDWGTGSITYVDVLDELPIFFVLNDEDGVVSTHMVDANNVKYAIKEE